MNRTIKVVHEFDLEPVFKELGVFEDYKNKKLTCESCNKPLVKPEDFSTLKKKDGKVVFFCDTLACIIESEKENL